MGFSLELKSCEVSASPLIQHSFSVNSHDFNYYLLMNSKATPLVYKATYLGGPQEPSIQTELTFFLPEPTPSSIFSLSEWQHIHCHPCQKPRSHVWLLPLTHFPSSRQLPNLDILTSDNSQIDPQLCLPLLP